MENHWLDYLNSISSILTPILLMVLTAVGWQVRRRFDRKLELEDKLREDRLTIYNHILEPFIILFMSDEAWKHDKQNRGKNKNEIALEKMLSLEYRTYSFKISLFGSDSVVSSFNELMQHIYSYEENSGFSEEDKKRLMSLFGNFLLQIRRSMCNESSRLDRWQMLELLIKDVRKYRDSSI